MSPKKGKWKAEQGMREMQYKGKSELRGTREFEA